MKALKCEMCGSNDIVKQDGLYVCQNCGTKYTVDEARKMMVEGTVEVKGTVKIDDSLEFKNILELARRAKKAGNVEDALKYYEMILIKDPNNWEASFFVPYYTVESCNRATSLNERLNAAKRLNAGLRYIIGLVKKSISDERELENALMEMCSSCILIADTVYVKEGVSLLYNLGDLIVEEFGDKYGALSEKAWKNGVRIHGRMSGAKEERKIMRVYTEKIKKYDPSYSPDDSMGCYVATAVYGSYNCPEVWTLRRFRDNTLDATWYGRAFIQTYYAISPTLVKWFGETTWFKRIWRGPLDKLVNALKCKGVEDTPYMDKY